MPAGTEAHQLVGVCQVGAALIILSFKPCQIDQQLSWSWLTCIGGNCHVSPPHWSMSCVSSADPVDVADTGFSWIGAFIRFFLPEFSGARSKKATANPRRRAGRCRTGERTVYTRSARRA